MLLTDTNNTKDIVGAIDLVFKCVAIIVGAVWILFKFIRTRENHPKIELTVDLRVIGRHQDKIIIEVIIDLLNKGLVRHYINSFTCNILIFTWCN